MGLWSRYKSCKWLDAFIQVIHVVGCLDSSVVSGWMLEGINGCISSVTVL